MGYVKSKSSEVSIKGMTAALNPYLSVFSFRLEGLEYMIDSNQSKKTIGTISYDDKPTEAAFTAKNNGDEALEMKLQYAIDGGSARTIGPCTANPGSSCSKTATIAAEAIKAGSHTITYAIYARKKGTSTWYKYYSNVNTYTVESEPIPTALSIAIVNSAGNPITEATVGDKIYIGGKLTASGAGVANQYVYLWRNGTKTVIKDATDANGVYSIAYTVVSGDVPTVKFQTSFGY